MKQWNWYVYIIECLDGSYYTGITWDASVRYEQHLTRVGGKYTKEHGVKRLVYLEEHDDLDVARKREIQIKDWNRRKKEKLIKGDWKKDW